MIQLAIETSGRTGSLAILRDSTLLQGYPLPSDQRTAASLAPTLQIAIDWCAATKQPIDFVSVAEGPGSFTGLRIGVTTAKTLCYATGLPLVAVDSVAAVASLVFAQEKGIDELAVAINAYRGQVFAAHFQRSRLLPDWPTDTSATMAPSGPLATPKSFAVPTTDSVMAAANWRDHMRSTQILDDPQWQQWRAGLPAQIAWSGDWGKLPSDALDRYFPNTQVDAYGVGLLGDYAARWQQWSEPLRLTPRYLKPSAAEEQQEFNFA